MMPLQIVVVISNTCVDSLNISYYFVQFSNGFNIIILGIKVAFHFICVAPCYPITVSSLLTVQVLVLHCRNCLTSGSLTNLSLTRKIVHMLILLAETNTSYIHQLPLSELMFTDMIFFYIRCSKRITVTDAVYDGPTIYADMDCI